MLLLSNLIYLTAVIFFIVSDATDKLLKSNITSPLIVGTGLAPNCIALIELLLKSKVVIEVTDPAISIVLDVVVPGTLRVLILSAPTKYIDNPELLQLVKSTVLSFKQPASTLNSVKFLLPVHEIVVKLGHPVITKLFKSLRLFNEIDLILEQLLIITSVNLLQPVKSIDSKKG